MVTGAEPWPRSAAVWSLGAYPRIVQEPKILDGIVAGIGFGILLNTRPWESLSLGAVFTGAFFLWAWRQPWETRWRTAVPMGIAILATLAPFLAATLIEAKAVTGSAFDLPHEAARRELAIMPTFVFQHVRPIPSYDYEEMRKFYSIWEPAYEDARHWGTLSGLVPGIVLRARAVGACYFPDGSYLPFALLSFLTLWSRRIRLLGVCVIAAFLGNALVNWLVPHYLAPVLGAMMALHLQFLRWIRKWNLMAFVAVLALLCCLFGFRYIQRAGKDQEFAITRQHMIDRLQSDGRRHIVFVRYRPDHNLQEEWVFNGPDIFSQRVIWARSMSPVEDRKLAGFASDRVAWIVDADAPQPVLEPASATITNKR